MQRRPRLVVGRMPVVPVTRRVAHAGRECQTASGAAREHEGAVAGSLAQVQDRSAGHAQLGPLLAAGVVAVHRLTDRATQQPLQHRAAPLGGHRLSGHQTSLVVVTATEVDAFRVVHGVTAWKSNRGERPSTTTATRTASSSNTKPDPSKGP